MSHTINVEKTTEISITDMELVFIEECVDQGFYCSEMENAESLAISILRKIKKAKCLD